MAQQKKRSKRHHTVPKLHLRRFANEQEQVVGFRREDGRSVLLSLSDASVQKDFYALETEDGLSSALEDLLADLEGQAAPIIDRMIAGEFPLDPASKGVLAEFIALQWQRGTGQRENFRQAMDAIMKRVAAMVSPEEWAETIRRSDPDEDAEARATEMHAFLRKTDSYWFEPTQNEMLKILVENVERTADYFAARTWQLLEFNDATLLTSDDPVTLWSRPDRRSPLYGIGAANAQEIRMPLGRHHALVMAIPSLAPLGEAKRVLGSEHARALNTHSASNAHRWIFYHPSDTPLDGLVLRGRSQIVID